MTNDRLVLTLIRRDAAGAWRALSLSDKLWIGIGGGLLVAYGVIDVVVNLGASAAAIRDNSSLWLVRAPLAVALLAAWLGSLAAKAAAQRALAPFLRALPLSLAARRRMAAVAGVWLGAPGIATVAILTMAIALIVAQPNPLAWGIGEAAVGAAAYGAAFALRLRSAFRNDGVRFAVERKPRAVATVAIGPFDGGGALPWLGSWAWGLSAGRVAVTVRLALVSALLGLGMAFAMAASLARRDAAPAAVAALVGGLAVFMLTMRTGPLASPVLRSSPLAFGRAVRRLARLPLMLSGAFFAVPAGAATAAEPHTVVGRLQDGLGLVILDGAYVVFAATFELSPLAAFLSFAAAVLYSLYEASEFGGAMIVGFAGLLGLLWTSARRRYRHG